MGMKLKDFVKDDNLKLTETQIENLLVSILGEPDDLFNEIRMLKTIVKEYTYSKGSSLVPMYPSQGYSSSNSNMMERFVEKYSNNNIEADAA